MKILKKTLAVVLCAALTVSLFAGLTLYAEAAGTYNRTELEKVIADTAIAYYLKGPDCQYDSFTMSGLSRARTGIQRQTVCRSPEDASPDQRYYTVCSSFPNDVYYDVFGVSPLLPSDMAGAEEGSGNATIPEKTGLPVENLTDKDLEYPIGMISLTSYFCSYGKKVARIGDTNTYERGWIGHDFVAFFWGDNSFDSISDAELAELKNNLRPGDILSAVKGDEEDEDGENSGHTMIFLGDYKGDGEKYLIHATGSSKYNNNDTSFMGTAYSKTNSGAIREGVWTDDGTAAGSPIIGYDRVESSSSSTRNGVIAISTFDSLIGRGKTYGPGSSGDSVIKQFVAVRPIDRLTNWTGAMSDVSDDDQFPKSVTYNAFARMRYPGLEITTIADKNQNNDVQAGGTVTYSVIVENDTNLEKLKPRYGASGTNNSGMVLTVKLPTNAAYLSHSVENNAASPVNGDVAYNAEQHAVVADGFTSAAGAAYRLNVTVQIDPAAQLGDKVVLPNGKLTGPRTSLSIRTAGMTHIVGGAHPTGFGSITESSVESAGARKKTDAANDVYAALGYKLNLPDTQTILNSVLTYTYNPTETSRRMQSRLLDLSEITDPDALLLRRMIVPEYIGGRKLFTANAAGVKTNRGRMTDFNEAYLQPGDILVYAYTGAASENTGRAITAESDTVKDPECVYVYLGNSDYAYYDASGAFHVIHAPLRSFYYTGSTPKGEVPASFDRNGNTPGAYTRIEWSAVLTQAFRYSYFLCLRPSLAYASLPTMTPSSSAAYLVTTGGVTAGYATFDAALTAANASAGSILTLRGNTTMTANAVFSGGTLDLGGNTLSTDDYTLTLGSGASSQTLQNGTVTGNGTPVACADSSATEIRGVQIFGGKTGAALTSSDAASVALENVGLASASTGALPVRTASGGTLDHWTFRNDVTLLVPSALAAYDGNGAALGTDVTLCCGSRNAYFRIANADAAATYRPVTFTKDPTAVNETTGVSYASLSEALEKATAGDTLRLLRDLDTSNLNEVGTGGGYGRTTDPSNSGAAYAIAISKALTLDFDGHTISSTASPNGVSSTGSTAFMLNASPIVLKNGTIRTNRSWAFNMTAREVHLDNMRIYARSSATLISDTSRSERTLWVENGSLVVAGLGGVSGSNENNAVELRHGSVIVRGGSKLGSITGIAVRPTYKNATAEKPNTSSVTVEDGTLFTGRYAYAHNDSDCGYFDTGYDHTRNTSSLTFRSDNDAHYVREQHKEEVVSLPGYTAIVAVDRTVKIPGVVSNTTTGAEYDTLAEAIAAAGAGETLKLNSSASLTESAALPAGATLELGENTLTIPDGVTLDAHTAIMSAEAGGGLAVSGTVACSETPGNCIPENQVQMAAGGTYGDVTCPADESLSGQTVVPEFHMSKELSLNLNDTIVINHYLDDSAGTYTDGSYALVDGEAVPMVKQGSNWYLPVRESVAKEMGRESTVQPVGVDSEGTYHLGKPSTLSIRWYAEQLLGATNWSAERDAKLGRTMIGMLNYGAEAQKYFGYNTDDLANKNLTETDQARMTVYTPANLSENRVNNRTATDPDGIYYASSCVLGSSQALRFYFHLPESRTDRETLTFCATYRNYNGVMRTETRSFSELTDAGGGYCCFEVSGMAAADVKTDVTLTVKKAGSTIATVRDSIASYCARVYGDHPEVRELSDAVLIYGLSARDYFYKPFPVTGENEMPII